MTGNWGYCQHEDRTKGKQREKGGKQMKKWQITLIAVGGSLLVLLAVGYVMCNFIY